MSASTDSLPNGAAEQKLGQARRVSQIEWREHKSKIYRLYCIERCSMAQLREVLHGLNFNVSCRQLKSQLIRWGFRNHINEREMRTALKILLDQNLEALADSPRFRIGGQVYTHLQVLRYFRNRRTADLVAWVKDVRRDDPKQPACVELLGPQRQGPEAEVAHHVEPDCQMGMEDEHCDFATDSGYGGSLLDTPTMLGDCDGLSEVGVEWIQEWIQGPPSKKPGETSEDLTPPEKDLRAFQAAYMAAHMYGKAEEFDVLALCLLQALEIFKRMCTIQESLIVFSLSVMLSWLAEHACDLSAASIIKSFLRVALGQYEAGHPVVTLLEWMTAAAGANVNHAPIEFAVFQAVWHELESLFPNRHPHINRFSQSDQNIFEITKSDQSILILPRSSENDCSLCTAGLNWAIEGQSYALMRPGSGLYGYYTCYTRFHLLKAICENLNVYSNEKLETCDHRNHEVARSQLLQRFMADSGFPLGRLGGGFSGKVVAIKTPEFDTRPLTPSSKAQPEQDWERRSHLPARIQNSQASPENKSAYAVLDTTKWPNSHPPRESEFPATADSPARLNDGQESPKTSISSIGERSFLASMDSDELDQDWESDLDPILRLLRSKLICELVASFSRTQRQNQLSKYRNNVSQSASNESTSSSHVSGSVGSSSHTSIGKRGRSEDDPLDDIPEDESERPNRKKLRRTTKPMSLDGRLLACPYCKYDPTRYSERNVEEGNYQGCSSIYLTSIPRLKQHLYRTHKLPDHYCFSCFEIYSSHSQLSAHNRARPSCNPQDPKFLERMTPEQVGEIKRRTPGKGLSDTWFAIFNVETVSAAEVQQFIDHFYRQARERLFSLIQIHLQGRMLLESDQQRILDSALESAIAQVVSETGPRVNSDGETISAKELEFIPVIDERPSIQSPGSEVPLPGAQYADQTLGSSKNASENDGSSPFILQDWGSFHQTPPRTLEGTAFFEDWHAIPFASNFTSDPVEDGSYNIWATREMMH